MTPYELETICISHFKTEQWRKPLARILNVQQTSVRNWANGRNPIPDSVAEEILKVTGHDWPRFKWLLSGEPGCGFYITHTRPPVFFARAVWEKENGDIKNADIEGDVDTLTGITFTQNDLLLCEIKWVDDPPGSESRRLEIFEEAAEEILAFLEERL